MKWVITVFLLPLPCVGLSGYLMNGKTYCRMSFERHGTLLNCERTVLLEFNSIDAVWEQDSNGQPKLPLHVRCKVKKGDGIKYHDWTFTRAGIEPANPSDCPLNDVVVMRKLKREPFASTSIDGVKLAVSEVTHNYVEIEIAYEERASQGPCVYRRTGESWYHVLPGGNIPPVKVPNVGLLNVGSNARAFKESFPVSIWFPLTNVAGTVTNAVLVARRENANETYYAGYQKRSGLWALNSISFKGERIIDTATARSSIRLLDYIANLCEDVLPLQEGSRESTCKPLSSIEAPTGIAVSHGLWESSEGVRIWFWLKAMERNLVAVILCTNDAREKYLTQDVDSTMQFGDCLFMDVDTKTCAF